jgi:hypothetical protein
MRGKLMKGADQMLLEAGRPELPAHEVISYCLSRLYEDQDHRLTDFLAPDLTYEEVIGALLLGRDAVERVEKQEGNGG